MFLEVLIKLLLVHDPAGHEIYINPKEIVVLRSSPAVEGYLQEDIKCVIVTADGKYINAVEKCDLVLKMMEALDD
jgi:hypothetical protein